MAAKKAQATREGIARMRKITRDVDKLNGRIHSSSNGKAVSRSSVKQKRK